MRVLLSRLPHELWAMTREVHFNDRARGRRRLGYVNMGHREIAICALPARVGLSAFFACRPRRDGRNASPAQIGAVRGLRWPELAVRRFMLYEVFLHELGHLQLVDRRPRRIQRKFAGETRASEFATYWRKQLWSATFDHPDPVHTPPTAGEFAIEMERSGAGAG